ncbi:type I restriction endonuclease subunit R [Neisseria gonorrhoeae]|uniref:Type I restriction endonuclease subunit R n=1 Tax=Neisseria gonorrhoeae TaxID=485 RepID=A0AAX2TNG0_NEIGO|nr:type I restriction endonuclease [Neisseria gonorrhoeae]ANJ51848.1 type I restriction endonuclease subunit R [Neisseria gonorrhoeae]ASQ71492.1 type I restriction endonuclease subunit R [Neisseria gonorrhoeae]KLS24812.1 type I restriction enzyme R protein [Neisseria gonorrhoeae MIA_2011_05-10]KLS94287.1 type I restriction enzyme R protein [Neisseria gonorrhoeae MU_NG19]MBG9966629.1 type I restriction enzyme HsdR N-terminal domain-containing protein [Neisseria gonorrhoeae]
MNAAAVSAVFKERIASHAEHVKKVAHICTTEETTKQALILPLLDILGFSAFDPNKVRAEYQADFPGAKSGERVDYALFCNGAPVMFIEAKSYTENLSNHCPQLSRYFNATPEIAICAITNGREWRFFTDLSNKNIMDSEPFLTVDVTMLNENDMAQLYQFRHDKFQPDALRSLAEESIYLTAFTESITESLKEVDLDFVRYVAGRANIQRQFTQRYLESIRHIVKQAVQNTVSSMVVSGLSAPKVQEEAAPVEKEQEDPTAPIIDPENNKIVTTYSERRLFDLVKSILPDDASIEAKDTESYFGVLVDGKSNRWILRYFDNKQRPSVIFPIELEESDISNIERCGLEVSGNQVIIDTPENLLRVVWLVIDSYRFCCDDENFKRKPK